MGERASTGQVLAGVAVMGGWFAAAAAAVLWWLSRLSAVPEEGCAEWCLSDQIGMAVAAILFGIPAVVVGLVAGAIVLARVTRRTRSGLVAGTLAALAGLLIGPAVVLLLVSALRVVT